MLEKRKQTTTTKQINSDYTVGLRAGNHQIIFLFNSGCGLGKTDLAIILDASTSVTEANFQKMRDFVKEFISKADIDSGSVRVGIIIYSTEVQINFHLDE